MLRSRDRFCYSRLAQSSLRIHSIRVLLVGRALRRECGAGSRRLPKLIASIVAHTGVRSPDYERPILTSMSTRCRTGSRQAILLPGSGAQSSRGCGTSAGAESAKTTQHLGAAVHERPIVGNVSVPTPVGRRGAVRYLIGHWRWHRLSSPRWPCASLCWLADLRFVRVVEARRHCTRLPGM